MQSNRLCNALARRSNAARGKKALAAVAALMQGVISHVAPRLSGDLERSNPERPWRQSAVLDEGERTLVTAAQLEALCDLMRVPVIQPSGDGIARP